MAYRINIIGGGRVGQTLGRLLTEHGHQVQAVLTQSPASAQAAVDFIGAGKPYTHFNELPPAQLWVLAVPDRSIANTALALAELTKLANATKATQPAPMVFHCSGALSSELLAPLRQQGWQCASVHVMLSFATPALAVQQLPGSACALEGDTFARHQLQALMQSLGAVCFEIEAHNKMMYHAAAVWATNFMPVLQHTAEQLWQQAGVPSELIVKLRHLLPLGVDNILRLGPQGALTGPASRGDTALVQAQALMLADIDPWMSEAYAALSDLARRMAIKETDQAAGQAGDQAAVVCGDASTLSNKRRAEGKSKPSTN